MIREKNIIHPGKVLEENLDYLKISQKELAQRMGMSEKHISEMINGKAPITPETALKLERIVGSTAKFWNNLERNYQAELAKEKQLQKLNEEAALASRYTCYSQLEKLGYVGAAKNYVEKAEELLKFFRIDSLKFAENVQNVAFRRSNTLDINKESLFAWLRCGEIEAQNTKVSEFNAKKLRMVLEKIRALTIEEISKAGEKLKEILANCGVVLIYTPYFQKTYINGACRWYGENPLVQISDRGRSLDIFWFNLFHELAHILLHSKKDRFFEFDKKVDRNGGLMEKEREANLFASNELISDTNYRFFLDKNNFSENFIIDFSKQIGIHPSILAGRVAHDGLVKWSKISHLRPTITIKQNDD